MKPIERLVRKAKDSNVEGAKAEIRALAKINQTLSKDNKSVGLKTSNHLLLIDLIKSLVEP